jgi:hypothetical protein
MDRTVEFVHPLDAPLLAYFKRNSAYDRRTATYSLRARPDLTGELHDIIAETDIPASEVKNGSVYGGPVVANRNGLVFAWTGGTNDVFLRVKQERVDAACGDGARVDPTYPSQWLNFYVMRLGQDWREILKRWVKIAYEDSFALA